MDLAGMKRRELQALCKRHGLPAGGSNANLVARLDAALSGAAAGGTEEDEEVVAVDGGATRKAKGCLKQRGRDAAEAKKVTFAVEERKARRLRSRVIWSPGVAKKRGNSAQVATDSAAVAEDGISAELSPNVQVRQSRRNSMSAAEELGESVAVDRKRKRNNQENDKVVAVSSRVGVSARVTRRSSLGGAVAVLPAALEKKRDNGEGIAVSAEVGVSARVTRRSSLAVAAVEKKRGRGKAVGGSNELAAESQECEPDVHNPAQVEVSARMTRSRATEPIVMSPIVIENKRRRKTGDAQTNVELSKVSDVPRNDAPVTRSLRNRVVEVNSMVEETQTARQLENKTQPSRPSTRRHKQVPSSVEDKNQEQIAVPSKDPLLRRSGRNNSEAAEKQPATKGPVRGLRHKSVVSELHVKEKGLTAEKNMEAHNGRSMRKPVIPVKDIKAAGEGIQNAKGKDVEKQFVVKQPTRHSSRKSVVPDMLENNSGLVAAEMHAEMNVRRSTRKSVLPNMLNEENQYHSKMARKKNPQSGVCQDGEMQQKVKEPIRRSRRSVAAVPHGKQSNGLHEEKMTKKPMRRSTRRSVVLNEVEKVSMDAHELVARELEIVGEEGLQLRKQRRSLLEISPSANDSRRKQQNTQIPNEKDNVGGAQETKRRRTTSPEEVVSVKEANNDIIIVEATEDAYKDTLDYKESSSRVHEFVQDNATQEGLSSGPLLVTVTLTNEISTAQSVTVVIPESEFGDNANESSDKSKQEYSDIQAVDSQLSETSGELDQSSSIAVVVPENCVVSEDEALMGKDGLSINFTVGDREEQIPISGEGRVAMKSNASESGEKNVADIMSTSPESLQHDIDIIADEIGEVTEENIRAADLGKCPVRHNKGNPLSTSLHLEGAGDDSSLPVLHADGCSSDGRGSSFDLELMFTEECKECYSRNTENTAVEIDGGNKPITRVTPGFNVGSDCLEDEDVQPTGCDAVKKLDADEGVAEEEVLAQEKCNGRHVTAKTDLKMKLNDELDGHGRESGCSITEKSIWLVADNFDEQVTIQVQQRDVQEGESGDLEKLSLCSVTPECKHDGGLLEENTAIEIGGGNKLSTPVTPGFYVGSDCLEDEDMQPTRCDAVKKLDADEGVADEEVIAGEKCNVQHVTAKTDLKIKLNNELDGHGRESGYSITEKSTWLVADNLDEQVTIQVQQHDVQEGDLEKLSLCLVTPECKHECGLPEENTAVEIGGGNKPSTLVTPGFYVGSDCLEDEDLQPTSCDAVKKLDADQGGEEEVLAREKCNVQHVTAKTDLKMKLNDEHDGPGRESGCSITEKSTGLVADNLDEQVTIHVQHGNEQEGDLEKLSLCSVTPECKHECGLPEENTALEIGGGNKPGTPITPDLYVGSDCLEDEDVQPTGSGCDADKKLDVDQGVTEEEVFAWEKSNDHHVPAKTDLYMKLNAEESPFVLESLFSLENIDESKGSARFHTEDGFNDSIDCQVKSALKHSHVSHDDIEDGVSKNDDGMHTTQQDNGMEEANLDEGRVLSVYSLDAKHIKEVINSEDVACEGEGSKKLVHSEEIKTDINGPDVNSYGIMDAVLSLHTPNSHNYEICLGSNTDVLLQGHNDQCSDHTEERFASKPWTNDIIEDAATKYIESGIVLLADKERSDFKDAQLNSKIDSGSVVGEITPSDYGLSKDSAVEYRQDVLDVFSMKTSLDGSSKRGEKTVCRVDAIENPSISSATSGYKHECVSSEEAVCTMKNYAGTCSSDHTELFMELQSLFSKGNKKEFDPHGGLAFPSAENSGDDSINLEQRVKVHNGSDMSHLGSTNLLDDLIGCCNSEELCQGHDHKDRSNLDRVQQIASEPCTDDIVEAAATAAKCIKSELVLLPSEERSNLNDGQLNPKLESANIMGSGLMCDKEVCITSDNGSVVVVAGERPPSGSGLPEDHPKDHYPRQEFLDGFSVESSIQGTIFVKKIVSGVAGTGDPSSSLTTCDSQYEGALSMEAVCRMKNCTGTCSADPKQVLMERQSLHSEGSTEKSDLQDNLAFPCAESCHVEKLVDTLVSLEPDTYQGPCQDLSRHEEKESCMSVPMQVKESGGFLRSSHMKGSLTSVQIDLADEAHLIERDIVDAVEGLCDKKVERTSMPTSDRDILQEKSYSNGFGICESHSQKHIVEANSRLSSCGTEVLHQDHKEECNDPNEGKFSRKALVDNNTAEDAPIEGMESSILLPFVAGMSEIPDEQLNTKMSDESVELNFSCDIDTNGNFCTGPPLPKDFHIDSCQKQVPEVLSLPKSLEESAEFQCVSVSGSGPCQQHVNESSSMLVAYNIDDETLNQDHDKYNQNNEDQRTPGIRSSSVPETVEIEQSEMEMGLIPAAEASGLSVPDEQLNNNLDGNEVDEQSCSNDKDFSSLPDTEFLNREASILQDDCIDLSSEDNHQNYLPAPRSPQQSAYFQNDNDLGSVAGSCESSRQRCIDELGAKLQSFKVSSTVRGSYIAMSAPHTKPGDSMSQSAITMLRNIENTTAVKAGHPVKHNADGKDSSRRALQLISGRPREH